MLAYPPIVVRLLFDGNRRYWRYHESPRGFALIALGTARWPDVDTRRAFQGMVTYTGLATLYLVYIGVRAERVGLLWWPAVGVHAILIVLLGGARHVGACSRVGFWYNLR